MVSKSRLQKNSAFISICLNFFPLLYSTATRAADAPYIAVGNARVKKTVIAFPDIRPQGGSSEGATKLLAETIVDDLTFMDFFKFLGKDAFVERNEAGITLGSFKMTDWSSVGAEVVIKSALAPHSSGFAYELHVFETQSGKELLNKKLLASASEIKLLGHTASNQIVEALTGQKGIFLTKLAMSCDRGGKNKEIYAMNIDGTDVKRITHHRSTAFAPAWSPDSTRLAYSLYTKNRANIKNIDLYEYNFKDNSIRKLSDRKGINSGAAYSPDGSKIALTMSFLGNPEIFVFDPKANSVTRLTKSMGFDVDPSWSPDGSQLAFVSNRTGMPMVFTMKADGSDVKRLTFAGRYNATPNWSPTGKKVTFAGWIDGIFDIFTMNADGTNIERLTKDQGNNEDPVFSPDGNFVAFSSNRTGQKNIYVMNIDGSFVKRLTYGLGNCVSPKWSDN